MNQSDIAILTDKVTKAMDSSEGYIDAIVKWHDSQYWIVVNGVHVAHVEKLPHAFQLLSAFFSKASTMGFNHLYDEEDA